MKYYLYIISCPAYAAQDVCKIGCTSDPHSRLQTYLTSYPPDLLPYDIDYYGLWEIEADDHADMVYKEGIIHDEFYSVRKKRDISSEWFQINNFLKAVGTFIESCEFTKQKVNLADLPRKKRSPLETVQYPKNRRTFLRKEEVKNTVINELQSPVVQRIQGFIQGDEIAGQLIAPCGSGKTVMTCKAIQNLKKIIICAPSLQIQRQWINTIKRDEKPLLVGGVSDSWDTITTYLNSDKFCVITTYASCKKLVDVIPNQIDIIVFDEAHHMVGLVSDDKEKGIGITRVLLKTIADKCLKRLFLTFTPKDANIEEDDMTIMSMHDEDVFGKVLYEIKLRSLIQRGILPDYNIWALSSEGTGLTAKMEQLLLAWNSNQIHHLIVFTKDLTEKEEVKKYLQKETDSLVLSIDDAKMSSGIIDQYTNAKRAILVDCKRLGEGVDIPVADSVAILYAKESIVEIVQMVLRAGRWYKNKSVFHILLPHTVDEDMSGIQNVLYYLAKYDEALRGELLLASSSQSKGESEIEINLGLSNDHIQYEILNSMDLEKMKQCFENIRTKLVQKTNKREIQKLCLQRNIKTSKEYDDLRSEFSHIPDDPRFPGMSWFDFLNPTLEKITLQEFGVVLSKNNKRQPSEYAEWQSNDLPSLQNIRDGYFGEQTNFLEIVEKFVPIERRRR
jgi:superfamily II DNA or RNA helicase